MDRKNALTACYHLKMYNLQVMNCLNRFEDPDYKDPHSIEIDAIKDEFGFIEETIEFLVEYVMDDAKPSLKEKISIASNKIQTQPSNQK